MLKINSPLSLVTDPTSPPTATSSAQNQHSPLSLVTDPTSPPTATSSAQDQHSPLSLVTDPTSPPTSAQDQHSPLSLVTDPTSPPTATSSEQDEHPLSLSDIPMSCLTTSSSKQRQTSSPQSCVIKEKLNCSPKLNEFITHDQLPTNLMEIFPPLYQYNMFQSFKATSTFSFDAIVRIGISTQQAVQWIRDLEDHTTYRITRGNKCKGKRVVFKTDQHCQHKRKQLTAKQKASGK